MKINMSNYSIMLLLMLKIYIFGVVEIDQSKIQDNNKNHMINKIDLIGLIDNNHNHKNINQKKMKIQKKEEVIITEKEVHLITTKKRLEKILDVNLMIMRKYIYL